MSQPRVLIPRATSFLLSLSLGLNACLAFSPRGSTAGTFRPEILAEMDAAITEAIANEKCPGGVLWLEQRGVAYHKAYGHRAVTPAEEPMTEDTIFDAASLTKVVACTPAIMLLVERGQVKGSLPLKLA